MFCILPDAKSKVQCHQSLCYYSFSVLLMLHVSPDSQICYNRFSSNTRYKFRRQKDCRLHTGTDITNDVVSMSAANTTISAHITRQQIDGRNRAGSARRCCPVIFYTDSVDNLLSGSVLQSLPPKRKLNADTDDYGSGVSF
ncbi:uncharacterized protein LOC109610871 [Ooceraea biroi]|uniref:uncharacterized protein LOC109610871 n=1 Tax=Ooceraea biroi TaxID=2015173 RepID=UPI0009716675|nr:uncharacterized protein LOC109610871 [Ooceraea biroi]